MLSVLQLDSISCSCTEQIFVVSDSVVGTVLDTRKTMVDKTYLVPTLMKLSLKLINNIIINVFLTFNTNKQDDVIEKNQRFY